MEGAAIVCVCLCTRLSEIIAKARLPLLNNGEPINGAIRMYATMLPGILVLENNDSICLQEKL